MLGHNGLLLNNNLMRLVRIVLLDVDDSFVEPHFGNLKVIIINFKVKNKYKGQTSTILEQNTFASL